MSVIVRVPAPLRGKTGGRRLVELSASSFGELLVEMEAASAPAVSEQFEAPVSTI